MDILPKITSDGIAGLNSIFYEVPKMAHRWHASFIHRPALLCNGRGAPLACLWPVTQFYSTITGCYPLIPISLFIIVRLLAGTPLGL